MSRLWHWATLCLGFGLLAIGSELIAPEHIAFAAPAQRFERTHTTTPLRPKRIAQGEHALATHIRIGEVSLLSCGSDPEARGTATDIPEDFRRGKDVAQVLWRDTTGARQQLMEALKADSLRAHVVANLFQLVVDSRPIPQARSWGDEIIHETQGLDAAESGNLQRLLLASDAWDFLAGEGLLIESPSGPVLLARYTATGVSTADVLVPMLLRHRQTTIFMLSLFGVSMPMAGMNEDGLCLARFAPERDESVYIPAVGPDAGWLARSYLLHYATPGFEATDSPGGEGIATNLGRYSEPSPTILSRLATPGILLAANRDQGFRFEWKSVGNAQDQSCGLEFEFFQGTALAAMSAYLSPELTKPERRESGLLADCRAMGPGDFTLARIQRLVQLSPPNTLAVALFPATKRVMLRSAEGAYAEFPLSIAGR